MLLLILTTTAALASAGKSWSKGHDHGNHVDVSGAKSHLERLEVVCSKDHMTVHMHFDEPFYGVVFSHGSPRHERCIHVGPRAGITSASFDIKYDGCGTVEHLSGRFHENTIVIQFDEDILEAWDEAKRLRCEWLESFEKQSSKPTLAISDLDVVELNFQGDDIDCWMEVQEGKGPWSRQVGGLVPIGSPLTLVIAINDHSREFDMRIKRCSAGDGTGSEIELTDHNGCVLRPKLLTPFAKVRDFGAKATLVAYSHIYAFKFPDKMDVFVHCIVEVCRHGCTDSCGHQNKDYHAPGRHFDSLEAKKIEKLANFGNYQSFHEIRVSGHHHPLKTPASGSDHPFPGRERGKEELVPAAQKQIHHIALKNSSFGVTSLDNKRIVQDVQRATFKPPPKEIKTTTKETNSHIQSSSTNVHGVFVDIQNSLQAETNSKFSSQQHFSHDIQSVPTAHRIIGHDAHWISEGVKKTEDHHNKHNVPSLKDISYLAPQPEPATWSADEVKPLTKHEVFKVQQAPKPEPSKWSADEVKSLLKHEVFQVKQAPKPEPATWSADEVKSFLKHEVFQVKQPSKPQADTSVHHYHSNTPYVTKIHWASDDYSKPSDSLHSPLRKPEPLVPQPEPAAWTFEDVNPMHSPEVIRLQLHTQPPPEPKPEPGPSSWTFEDVKGLSKENLRILSLNHKMKSHSDIPAAPVYKEFVHPFSTSTVPQPVFISRYTLSPQNMSTSNMMKMMMMMPTMLPVTYQTAHWPQRTTSRYLRPNRHHYPYPIPQFSPHQQMMMSVIADRRMDEGSNEDSLPEDLSLYHNLKEGEEAAEPRRIQIGETVSSELSGTNFSTDDTSDTVEVNVDASDKKIPASMMSDISPEQRVELRDTLSLQSTPEFKIPPEEIVSESVVSVSKPMASAVTVQVHESSTVPEDFASAEAKNPNGPSGVRPAILSFVPPSLDAAMGENPESKERVVPGPRALDRRKRSSEPVFGVRQKFQAIAPSDLAFEWNLTADSATVLRGRREEIVYGICISPAGMSASVGFILILTLLSIIASVVLYEHSCQLSNKTSQLSFLTKNFNGQFEALYKITRPYLYSDNRTVR